MEEIAPTESAGKRAVPPEGKKWNAMLGLLRFDLSGSGLRLGLYLIHKANPKTGQCNPGAERIMADTCMAERTIKRARAELRREGIIRSKQLRRTSSNDYSINWRTLVDKVPGRQSRMVRNMMGVLKKADRAAAATGVSPSEAVKDFAADVCEAYDGFSGDPIGGLAKPISEDR
jgi:hypothetical protein